MTPMPVWPTRPSCQGSAGGPVDLQAFLEAVSHTSCPVHFGYMQNGSKWSEWLELALSRGSILMI